MPLTGCFDECVCRPLNTHCRVSTSLYASYVVVYSKFVEKCAFYRLCILELHLSIVFFFGERKELR